MSCMKNKGFLPPKKQRLGNFKGMGKFRDRKPVSRDCLDAHGPLEVEVGTRGTVVTGPSHP